MIYLYVLLTLVLMPLYTDLLSILNCYFFLFLTAQGGVEKKINEVKYLPKLIIDKTEQNDALVLMPRERVCSKTPMLQTQLAI